MRASSLTKRIVRCGMVKEWEWWKLPMLLRIYVALPAVGVLGVVGVSAVRVNLHLADIAEFAVLVCCGVVSVASTPKVAYAHPGVTRDFSSVWVLPTAILLPPMYAVLMPIPLGLVMHYWVHKGLVYRKVFTVTATGLSYGAASLTFRLFPVSFAGPHVGSGLHAFTWAAAVAACEVLGGRAHHFLILAAVKMSNPKVRVRAVEWNREALQGLFVEIDLGVLITLAVGLSPALVLIAVPTVLLVRRFMIFPILEAQSRIDAKTGLLNVSTWEAETETELDRAVRTRSGLAIALVDIDHFKQVNDTHGHLVGDKVLKAVADSLTSHLRDYDRAGRFGGEEFVLLFAQTSEDDACKIAQRLRTQIESMSVPVDDRPEAPVVQVTISIGVTAITKGDSGDLTDLLAAADSALYYAKQSGRNRVAFAPPEKNLGLDSALTDGTLDTSVADANPVGAPARNADAALPSAALLNNHRVVLVHSDQTALSLCLGSSLSVPVRARHGFIVR
jgi:diguanylate cyclase (GGDEF)-like protein